MKLRIPSLSLLVLAAPALSAQAAPRTMSAPDHVALGEWNAEIMRLNGFSRFMAKNVLGGKAFGEASWDNAIKYMEEATALDPTRIDHHLDLARIYKDRDMKDKAREQLEWIARAPAT